VNARDPFPQLVQRGVGILNWRIEQRQILSGTTDLVASEAQFERQGDKPLL
jgi:hypothetical protein